MSEQQVDIQRVVREVVRRLTDSGALPQPTTPHANDGKKHRPVHNTRNPDSSRLELPQRVVSLAQLDGQLSGVRKVAVSSDAVITPSVRDLLRAESIELEFVAAGNANAAAAGQTLVIGVAETEVDVDRLLGPLRNMPVRLATLAPAGLASVVAEMTDRVARSGELGVLFTGRSFAALCLANRSRRVRAIAPREPRELDEAMRQVGANLLILESASPHVLRTMLTTFVVGTRVCPAELAESSDLDPCASAK